MPIGRVNSDGATFGILELTVQPPDQSAPGQGGTIWRQFNSYVYVTLHRIHLMVEATFSLPPAGDYEIRVAGRAYGPGHFGGNSKTKNLIHWLTPHVKRPESMIYQRPEGQLLIRLGDRDREARGLYPEFLSAEGGWPVDGEPDLETIARRLHAMRPVDQLEKGPERLLIREFADGSIHALFGPRNWDILKLYWLDTASRPALHRQTVQPKGNGFEFRSQEDLDLILDSLETASRVSLDERVQERLENIVQALQDLRPGRQAPPQHE